MAAHLVAQARGALQIDLIALDASRSRVVFDRVSAETSTANQPSPFSVTTVRQQPACEIDAPRSTVAVS
jgi:hypothetical protein